MLSFILSQIILVYKHKFTVTLTVSIQLSLHDHFLSYQIQGELFTTQTHSYKSKY